MRRRLLIGATVAIALVALWYAVAPLGFASWHIPIDDSPAKHGLAFETIEFEARDQPVHLRAWWMPAAQPKAALVMVHGGGSNRAQPYTEWLGLAAALIGHGYAVLAPDLRNHGESGDSADGKPTFGVDEANDVVAAVDEIKRRDAALRVGVIGHSMGGQTVLYAAARDRRIEAVVSDSTYADAPSIAPTFSHAATGLPAALFGTPFVWSAELLHGIPIDRAHAVDVIATLAPRPVLIVHDAGDPVVPVAHAERLHAAYPASELWVTSEPVDSLPPSMHNAWGTHCRSYTLHPDEYVARATAFFDRAFAAAPST